MTRLRVAAGAVLLAVGVGALLAALAVFLGSGGGGPVRSEPGSLLAAPLSRSRPATAPLTGFTEADVAVGDRCLRVAVADEAAERQRGLRGQADLGPYDGMLFVEAAGAQSAFTMAGTPMALDIGFYDSRGREVDRRRMVPCPEGDDATCPLYKARREYRYALEMLAGESAAGALGPCRA